MSKASMPLKVLLGVSVLWTASVAGFFFWDSHMSIWNAQEMAIKEARGHFNKDVALRKWAARHGGVYVPVDERTRPNPALSHIAERDISTPSGIKLTLMNPAYLLRQVMSEYEELYGVKGRITGFKPLNPDNAPDEWEAAALHQFERGETEVFEQALINGVPYIRLMSAMVADEYCMKCHSRQGYRVGDVLGGVGVSVPLQSYLEGVARVDPEKVLLLAVIWIMGLAAIYAIGLLIRRRVEERKLNEAALIRKNREIVSANAYLTRFAEISAHHLMEPTRRLVSYSQRLQGRLKTMPDEARNDEIYQDLQVLERDAAHLRMLVKDIQLFLAAGEPVDKVCIQDVDALVSSLLQRLESRLKRAHVRLHIDKLPPATLDKSRLIDLFWILMDNALSHGLPIDDNAVPEIHISGERVGKLSRYRISDNGPGIPLQYRERVFEIFERLTTTDTPAGAGIGLPIARRIVESRHGKIGLEDSPLGGISVVFELPDDN
ncbi:sensor histidine kinase [Methylotuvimicrobium buryatense]|nr:DUF3365 domain-containing protein [Methylotuvimicrobium buryatense]